MSYYSGTDLGVSGKILMGAGSKIVTYPGTQSDFEVDGNNETKSWFDITTTIVVKGSGPNDPTLTTVAQLGGVGLYELPGTGVRHEFWTTYHIPHSYAPGTGIFFHLHSTTTTANPTGNFKIFFEYCYASSGGVFSAPATISVVDNYTSAYEHRISETSTAVLANSLEVDGVVLVRCYRIPADDAQDTFTGPVLCILCDGHINISKLSTKYKDKLTTGSFYS